MMVRVRNEVDEDVMFTGIIEETGRIAALEGRGGDLCLTVEVAGPAFTDLQLGESIAVNGVCLTVVAREGGRWSADVSLETLSCTTCAGWRVGDRVNLERALLPSTRLGGHLVSGHVDGVGRVVGLQDEARSTCLTITAPEVLMRYIAAKGSVCVDGVSLTVNEVGATAFTVNIVPHTIQKTVIGTYLAGTRVNVEVDILARYLERLLSSRDGHAGTEAAGGVTIERLREHGYINVT
jgi:riboflavin synthase